MAATGKGTLLGRRVELTGMRADGSEFPVELAINQVAGVGPALFTGTVRDITHRRRADEEREEWLRLEQLARLDATQARDQLQAILSGVADAVTAQAPDGRLLFANDAALQLLGFESIEELQSAPGDWIRDRYEILDEEGSTMATEDLPGRRALAGEQGAEAVVRFRLRATGEERWSAVKATPILDDDGFVTMAINVIEDITTHKRAERAQRFLADSSALLGASLEPADVLGQVATLAVPEVADWVAVHMPGESGIELVALAHRDPELVKQAAELDRQMPTRHDAPRGVANVLRTGRSELYPDIPQLVPETDDERARAEHVRDLRDALGAGGADGRARQDARHAHAGDGQVGPPLRRARPRAGRGARPTLRDGGRQRPPVLRARLHRAHAPAEPAARPSCPTSPASRRPRASGRPARATRSAATSTTCSRAAAAAGPW